jgi:GTP cyclohydrolase I
MLSTMHDVQSRQDDRQIPIDQVGVNDLRYPIIVIDRQHGKQETVALLSMSVNLPHHFKGTHMSRFIEVLHEHRGEVTTQTIPVILRELCRRLGADSAQIEVKFPYFVERIAPVSKARGLMDYECSFSGELNGKRDDFVLGVRVPVTSLCPCSKEISDYGAHNQRGYLTIEVRCHQEENGTAGIMWIEDLIEIAETSASAPVYALIKRVDERHVTMQAYNNPVFVEDMVRNAASQLQVNKRVRWFRVYAVNDESIHNHNAFARLEWPSPGSAASVSMLTDFMRVHA